MYFNKNSDTIQPKLTIGQSNDKYEQEADRAADQVMKTPTHEGLIQRKEDSDFQMQKISEATPMIQKQGQDETEDSPLVKRAKKRLSTMEFCYGKYINSKVKKTSRDMSSKRLREKRKLMDKDGSDPLGELKEPLEVKQIEKLNKLPLNIKVSATKISFHIKLHVNFEGKSTEDSAEDFKRLTKTFNEGLELVWNHQIRQLMPLEGRDFEVIPKFVHIVDSTKRDHNYWLISVRPGDKSPLKYNDVVIGGDEEGVEGLPTSATDPMIDGGVMSIPPSHIDKPDILGHELMHLFGLVDRYMVITDISADKKTKTTRLEPTRAHLHKRLDPLGSQDSTLLKEDLNFIFDEYGVYDKETQREKKEILKGCYGMSEGQIRVEIEKLKKIIRTGKAPDSLIPIRTDFRDKIIDSANDI